MAYRILSLDGGGIRGVYMLTLLELLVDACPSLLKCFDLIAGTSTGGIAALALANGMHPADIVNLYQINGAAIFDSSWLRKVVDLSDLSGAEYDNLNLENVVRRTFGDITLGDLSVRVVIPSFDLDKAQAYADAGIAPPAGFARSWAPKFFHNFPGPDSDEKEFVSNVAMRTSAAPTYFPSYQHYIDGGVVANNPSMAALAQALDCSTGGQQLKDVRLLSLGTGQISEFVGGDNLDWGIAQWAKILSKIMIDGVGGVADYQCGALLGERYFRLNPVLPTSWAMDDVADIGAMINAAEQVDLSAAVNWLTTQFLVG